MTKTLILFITISLASVFSCSASAITPLHLKELEGRDYLLRASLNESPFVYCNTKYGSLLGVYTSDSLPLLEPEVATLVDFEKKDDKYSIKLKMRNLGDAKVEIYLDDFGRELSVDEFNAFIGLIAETTDIKHLYAAKGSSILHYAGSNHCPPADKAISYSSVSEAAEAGLNLCTSCFSGVSTLKGLRQELQLGYETARELSAYYLAVANPEKQTQLQRAGDRALEHWPAPKRGYHYTFELVQMDYINACACPGGRIFVSESLFDMCETPIELEAILAHEIAHVEMRHGYRSWRKSRKNAGLGALLGGVVAVVANSNNSGGTVAATAIAASVAAIALDLASAGYSRDQEDESDSYALNYIQSLYGETARGDLSNIFKKMQYWDETKKRRRESDSSWSSHPTFSKRIGAAELAKTYAIQNGAAYIAEDSTGTEFLRIVLLGVSNYTWESEEIVNNSTILDSEDDFEKQTVYHSDLRAFGFAKARNSMVRKIELKDIWFQIDGNRVKFDNREDTDLTPGQLSSFYVYAEEESPLGAINLQTGIPDTIEVNAGNGRNYIMRPVRN